MKKKLITLMTLLMAVCSGAWADADITYALTSFTKTTAENIDTYEYTFDETSYKNKTIWVEVPSASAAGTIAFIANSNRTDRPLYIYKTNGTVQDTERAIYMKTSYTTEGAYCSYTASDILTSGGKYYLVFAAGNVDCKFKGIKYTTASSGGGKTALTGAWSDAAPSFAIGSDASASLPTFGVSGGATITTDYTVTYSKVSGDDLATFTASGGITAIDTESAGTETIRATVALTETGAESYSIETTTYDCVITVANTVTATWAFSSGAAGQTAFISEDDVFSVNYVEVAKMTYVGVGSDQGVTGTKMQPTVSASDDKSEYVKFTVMPKKGITFVPTHIEFDALRWGTDGGQIHYYAECGNTSEELGDVNPNRNGKGKGWSHYSEDITAVSATKENPFSLSLYIYGLANNKQISFANIVITGTYTGTPEAEEMYSITTSVTPDGAGSVSMSKPASSLPEGVSVDFTPIANTGYRFLNKWTVNGNEEEGATYSIASLSANTTIVAQFVKQQSITYAEGDGASGTIPDVAYVVAGEDYVVENPFFLYKSGSTFTGWSDGSKTYAPGETIENVTEDITLTAQWATNTVALGDECTTVNWTFARGDDAPSIAWEGMAEQKYVQQVNISGKPFDAILGVNTTNSAGVDNRKGKLNNTSGTTNAQCNVGTVFSIPAVSGMLVKYVSTSSVTKDNLGFTDNGTDIKDQLLTSPDGAADNILTYKYTGSESTLYMVATSGSSYPSCLTVIYPGSDEELISTLSGRNYATYVTTKKLDFASAEGITAYIATGFNGAKDAIVLKEVDIVPSGTPIIVNTTTQGATVNVPITTADESTMEGNALVAGDGTTAWDGTDGYTYYYLASDQFHKATDGTLQSGKAYLKVLTSEVPTTSARGLGFVFEDDATGINMVQNSRITENGAYFNLAGQRVVQPTKGLYIVNGKKVVIK